MIVATIDVGENIVAPIIVGMTMAVLFVIGRWSYKAWAKINQQLTSNGKAHEAGTSGLNIRDALDENTRVCKALAATIEDHIIRDEQFFQREEIEREKLRAVLADRGHLISEVLDVLMENRAGDR